MDYILTGSGAARWRGVASYYCWRHMWCGQAQEECQCPWCHRSSLLESWPGPWCRGCTRVYRWCWKGKHSATQYFIGNCGYKWEQLLSWSAFRKLGIINMSCCTLIWFPRTSSESEKISYSLSPLSFWVVEDQVDTNWPLRWTSKLWLYCVLCISVKGSLHYLRIFIEFVFHRCQSLQKTHQYYFLFLIFPSSHWLCACSRLTFWCKLAVCNQPLSVSCDWQLSGRSTF